MTLRILLQNGISDFPGGKPSTPVVSEPQVVAHGCVDQVLKGVT